MREGARDDRCRGWRSGFGGGERGRVGTAGRYEEGSLRFSDTLSFEVLEVCVLPLMLGSRKGRSLQPPACLLFVYVCVCLLNCK